MNLFRVAAIIFLLAFIRDCYHVEVSLGTSKNYIRISYCYSEISNDVDEIEREPQQELAFKEYISEYLERIYVFPFKNNRLY